MTGQLIGEDIDGGVSLVKKKKHTIEQQISLFYGSVNNVVRKLEV